MFWSIDTIVTNIGTIDVSIDTIGASIDTIVTNIGTIDASVYDRC